MVLTKKGLAYLVIAYAFIGLSLILREPALTVFVIPNAILLLFSSRHAPVQSPRLRIVRRIYPPRSVGGESIDVAVEIFNESTESVDELHLEDHIPEQLSLETGMKVLTTHMRARERVEFRYRVSAPKRGTYVLGPVWVQKTDVMGFHEYSGEIPVFDELIVLPKMEKLGPIELRARRVGPWPGLVPSRKIGPGTEFYELRQYESGDELRRINWKASAKLGRLVTNEFEGEQVTDVLVVLDCSEGALSKLFDFNVAEFEVDLAASLCSQLIQQGNRVGLSVYSAARTWVDPGFGKRQLLRLLNSLAIVEPGRASVPMQYAVESVIVSVVPARSVIVFISPMLGEEIVNVIMNLGIKGYGVICFTPAVELNAQGMSEPRKLAKRILSAERRVKLGEVGRVARVVEFSPQRDLRYSLRRWKPWRKT